MRIFNRIVMILLLVGLFVLGLYAVVYALNLLGHSLSALLKPAQSFGSAAQNFMNGVQSGGLAPLAILVLVLVALVGLILLIFELKPPTPRRVRMDKGTFVTRGVVEHEVSAAADGVDGVLGSSVRVKARRRPGALVNLEARVRRGEDTGSIQRDLRQRVQEHLGRKGLPVSRLNLRMSEVDPRQAKTRVR